MERDDRIKLFLQPEKFLLSVTDKKENNDFDEHSRNMLLEDFFSTTSLPEVEGPLYLKADSKKGWKKYHFVLRASGLYYFPKDKVKSAKDLVCLATFDNNQVINFKIFNFFSFVTHPVIKNTNKCTFF